MGFITDQESGPARMQGRRSSFPTDEGWRRSSIWWTRTCLQRRYKLIIHQATHLRPMGLGSDSPLRLSGRGYFHCHSGSPPMRPLKDTRNGTNTRIQCHIEIFSQPQPPTPVGFCEPYCEPPIWSSTDFSQVHLDSIRLDSLDFLIWSPAKYYSRYIALPTAFSLSHEAKS